MDYFENNQKKARNSLLCFQVFGIVIGINLFYRIINFSIDIRFSFLDQNLGLIWLISIIVSGIIFINWYEGILANERSLKEENRPTNPSFSSLIWFVPIFNAVIPYRRLKNIGSVYLNHFGEQLNPKFKIFLNTWLTSFLIWYGIQIIIFKTTPLFPEDVELFYAFNPERRFFDETSLLILELIGLFSMIRIIEIINKLERNLKT